MRLGSGIATAGGTREAYIAHAALPRESRLRRLPGSVEACKSRQADKSGPSSPLSCLFAAPTDRRGHARPVVHDAHPTERASFPTTSLGTSSRGPFCSTPPSSGPATPQEALKLAPLTLATHMEATHFGHFESGPSIAK
ncbi:hypothetical protein IE81DRAFT_324073 [Ceraceosorus guamensis]|uniref:Uncharacterized protein n=1 Tax=Ceraceosorus guamensis TaxID=1522189 RepID=A0A316VWS5_9BASI|nr:hypothetical protein IE81DRAFT_324073 [Ceraceosorus guamensis]PWN41899.1 hypothetical protein IE81DRAFT_324073 [Ceraceosorus guamensis]